MTTSTDRCTCGHIRREHPTYKKHGQVVPAGPCAILNCRCEGYEHFVRPSTRIHQVPRLDRTAPKLFQVAVD